MTRKQIFGDVFIALVLAITIEYRLQHVVYAQSPVPAAPQTGKLFIPDSAKNVTIPTDWLRCYDGKQLGWCPPMVAWQDDLWRPEVQKALNRYIESHCEIAPIFVPKVKAGGSTADSYGEWTSPQHLTCTETNTEGQ